MAIQLDIKSELPTAIKWTNEHTRQLPQAKQRNAFKALEGASKQYLNQAQALHLQRLLCHHS